ncbi:MAG TPA: fasciclin domain-containing protein [Solirubrobacteraceae bacterium]|nr:fasciclin domain-containing protein [Solirubrobacteraceae bacterium]
MKRLLAVMLAGLAVAAPVTLARAPAHSSAAGKNIVQTAAAAGQFKTLVKLVQKAGLAGALSGSQKLTVFAPTDAAFAKVPKKTLESLLAHPAKLKAVLLYHVLSGVVPASKVVKLSSAKTLEGASVKIAVRGGSVYVNNAKVTKTNVFASNGVIHVINAVLIPPQ